MPNGFQGSLEEWQLREAPYVRLDPLLEEFATKANLRIQKNYHDVSRSLHWNDGLDKSIWVLPMSDYDETGNYRVGVIAFIDKDGERYWKTEDTKRNVPLSELDQALHHAWTALSSWTYEDLHLSKGGEKSELL